MSGRLAVNPPFRGNPLRSLGARHPVHGAPPAKGHRRTFRHFGDRLDRFGMAKQPDGLAGSARHGLYAGRYGFFPVVKQWFKPRSALRHMALMLAGSGQQICPEAGTHLVDKGVKGGIVVAGA